MMKAQTWHLSEIFYDYQEINRRLPILSGFPHFLCHVTILASKSTETEGKK